jgi:hypothetical protein
MLRELMIGAFACTALTFATAAFAQGQSVTTAEVTCNPLSDDVAQRFITEPGEHLVRSSGVECKAGDMMIQTRFQITDFSATYDCEIRVKGAKPYCFRL